MKPKKKVLMHLTRSYFRAFFFTTLIFFSPMNDTSLLQCFEPDILIEVGLKAKEEMNKQKILKSHPYKITELHLKDRPVCYQTYILVDGKRKQIRRSSKEALEADILAAYSDPIKAPTIESVYGEWILYRSSTRNGGTVKKDIWIWDTYYKGSKFVRTPVKDLKVPIIARELLAISEQKGLTQRKSREMKGLLNGVLDYAVYMDYIFVNPARQIHGISADVFAEESKKASEERIFSEEDARMLMEDVRTHFKRYDNPAYLAILMNFGLGLRIGELAALKDSDFDLTRGTLTLVRSEQSVYLGKDGKKVRDGSRVVEHLKKNRQVRIVPLCSYSADIFKESLEWKRNRGVSSEWLFAGTDGERITTNAINQALNRLCGRGNHTIRRTVITKLIRSSLFTQKEIQTIAGHKDWETTSKYYDYSDEGLTAAKMDQALSDSLSTGT